MNSASDLRTTPATLPWVERLGGHRERVAVHTNSGPITYAALAERVDRLADRLSGPRRLVHLIATNSLESIVGLLAAQAAGHVVLPTAADAMGLSVARGYRCDVTIDSAGDIVRNRRTPRHDLHPDLALLLSTSGSTGAGKLVRLSYANLAVNAAQIGEALEVQPEDCAALTLPISYCYGLSVLTTHLQVGASVMLPPASVVDECFWSAAAAAGVTTIPGVPHTFELLERSGFAQRDLHRLRTLTQAGGRMDPERVRHFAELGAERGFRLHVMYGQSEATARIAVLPTELAASHPDTVGRPVRGGHLEIVDGEIIYTGANVMLGYADSPADLALGRTISRLHTGDRGEWTDDGLLRIIGRTTRFIKILGHRIDLDELERRLRAAGHEVRVGGTDGRLAVAIRPSTGQDLDALRTMIGQQCPVPRDAIRILAMDDFPLLGQGKTDYGTITAASQDPPRSPRRASTVADLYADVLGLPVSGESTFVGLGGDSLSYVEASVRLESLIGHLPAGWHLMSVAELEAQHRTTDDGPAHRFRWQSMESSIWLRALSIVLIIGTHAHLFRLQGTANALLVIAGYQLARFQLAESDPALRTRRILRSAGRVAAPALVVILAAHLLTGAYEPRNFFLANWIFGQERLGPPWRFWFIEALVLGLCVIGAVNRPKRLVDIDRRHPFTWPMALCLLAFGAFRIPWWDLPVPRMHGSALVVLHLILLGWALARASTRWQQAIVTLVAIGMVGTFSWNNARDGLTLAVIIIMVWWPVSRVPAVLVPPIKVIAAASLFIYVSHWHVLTPLHRTPLVAVLASLAVGIGYWWAWTRLGRLTRRPDRD